MPGTSSLAGAQAGFCGVPLADFVGAVDFSPVRVEIDEKWASDTKADINWECQDA